MPEEGLSHRHGNDRDRVLPRLAPILDLAEFKHGSFYRDLIVEFVATLLFLFITVATIIGDKKQTGPCDGVGNLGIAWAFGGTYFILVYCTAGISGGYINPAVTLAMLTLRKVSLNRAVMYMIFQCLGAICGVALAKACMKPDHDSLGGAANSVAPGYDNAAMGAEIVGTFLLVCTVLATKDPERRARDSHVPVLAPLTIGFVVFVVHLATIPISGTGINPARSLGVAVIYNNRKVWKDLIIFLFGQILGAMAATLYSECVPRVWPGTTS